MKCEDCKFWDDNEMREGGDGLCRKKSPFLVCGNSSIPKSRQETKCREDNVDWLAIWPETFRKDWCGEFEKKESEVKND